MKNKVIIAIISILVIAGGVFAGLYFGTDIFKKEETAEETKNSSKLANKIETYLENSEVLTSEKVTSFSEKLAKSSYSNEGALSLKVSNISELSELNNIRLSFNGEVDPSSKDFEQNLAISYSGISIDANVVKNKDTFGIQSDLITGDEYIAIENNNLKDLFSKLGLSDEELSQIPNKIDFNSLGSASEYLPSEEELTKIADKYIGIIEKNVEGFDSKTSGSTKTIEVTEYDLYKLVINIVETAKDDDELLDMVVEYNNMYAELAGESETITKAQLKEALQEGIDSFEDSSANAEEGNKFVIKLTYDSDDLVEKAEISIYEDGVESSMKMEFTSTDDMIKIAFVEDGDEIAITLEKEESGDSVEYDLSVLCDIAGFNMEFMNMKVAFEDLDSDTVTQSIELSVSVPTGYQTASITLSLTNEITFEDVNITELTDSNAIILNNLSEEELQDVALDIFTMMGIY